MGIRAFDILLMGLNVGLIRKMASTIKSDAVFRCYLAAHICEVGGSVLNLPQKASKKIVATALAMNDKGLSAKSLAKLSGYSIASCYRIKKRLRSKNERR